MSLSLGNFNRPVQPCADVSTHENLPNMTFDDLIEFPFWCSKHKALCLKYRKSKKQEESGLPQKIASQPRGWDPSVSLSIARNLSLEWWHPSPHHSNANVEILNLLTMIHRVFFDMNLRNFPHWRQSRKFSWRHREITEQHKDAFLLNAPNHTSRHPSPTTHYPSRKKISQEIVFVWRVYFVNETTFSRRAILFRDHVSLGFISHWVFASLEFLARAPAFTVKFDQDTRLVVGISENSNFYSSIVTISSLSMELWLLHSDKNSTINCRLYTNIWL